jgi:hypothetical protein
MPNAESFSEKKLGAFLEQICSARISSYRISPGVSFGYDYFMQNLLFVAGAFQIKNL